MEELKKLLAEMGLPPVATAVVVLLTVILVFCIKQVIDQREKKSTSRRNTLKQYLLVQEEALLKAYRMLYEGKDLQTLSPGKLVKLISEADDIIMEPFTRYRAELPAEVKAKLYDNIHSVLAQFKPDPSFPRKIAPDAVNNLAHYRKEFLRQIESVRKVVNRHL